jgi:hypothetical protein
MTKVLHLNYLKSNLIKVKDDKTMLNSILKG